jgi:hypothetical protein
MTASSTATARSSVPLPRLRSRGGSGAGSSDQPPVTHEVPAGTRGRRNPRAASRFADIDVAEFLAVARSTLTALRIFGIHQLQQLDEFSPDPGDRSAAGEIHRARRAATRAALSEGDASAPQSSAPAPNPAERRRGPQSAETVPRSEPPHGSGVIQLFRPVPRRPERILRGEQHREHRTEA